MMRTRVLSSGVSVGVVLGLFLAASPLSAHAAWVNNAATQFQVGGRLAEIVPTLASTAPGIANSPALVDPTCGTQGGTSLALVKGSKLAGVDPVMYPIVLVVSCLDNGGTATIRSRLNFINPIDVKVAGTVVSPAGTVVKQLSTSAVPSNGWAHLVHRPDKGDLIGCGLDGSVYTIDYSQTNNTADGTATMISPPTLANGQVATSCAGLAWDAENDVLYQGLTVNGGNKIGRVVRFNVKDDRTTTLLGDFTNLPCPANGLAISGGVLFMSCAGLVDPDGSGSTPTTLVIRRLDKTTGTGLGVFPYLALPVPGTTLSGFFGLTSLGNSDPGLGDLACDPATFQKDATGRDLYRDAVWSRRGANGNGVAAVEFPAFTCGLPSSSVVVQNGVSFSPLAAGFSAPGLNGPGQQPLASCFDASGSGIVKDTDGDGLPDCWERNQGGSGNGTDLACVAAEPFCGGIDFDGDGTRDLKLCASVNTNGDGTTLTTECADRNHRDLFVQIGWMQYHKPDPLALSQTQSVQTAGVQSVREAFGAAPVSNPDSQFGIRLHIHVDDAPVTFTNLLGISTSHACYVALTPCTGPASTAPTSPPNYNPPPNPGINSTCLGASDVAADYDAIKAEKDPVTGMPKNFGRYDPAADLSNPPSTKALNAKRLAIRSVLFGHQLVGNPGGGANNSGCAEVGGDDAVVSLGATNFGLRTVVPVNFSPHNIGTTQQQAGTFMHELGHLLGLEHGGDDTDNCKPNYRSLMSYSRQFAGSPIPNRRLDYSRHEDLDLTKSSLNECSGIGTDAPDRYGSPGALGPIAGRNSGDAPFFSSADQIVFGPTSWRLAIPSNATVSNPCTSGQKPINWDSTNSAYQTSVNVPINSGPSADCTGSGTVLNGFNDWANIQYRLSASIDFAGGSRNQDHETYGPGNPREMTAEDEGAFFLARDVDGNGVGDGVDCGSFICTHRIDIKPSFPVPKTIGLGTEANVTIAIFSEKSGAEVWDAPAQIIVNNGSCPNPFPNTSPPSCLILSVGSVVEPVKTNKNGQGTCSISDVADPNTGVKDGIKDLKCQFPTSGLPSGTDWGIVSGYFWVDPACTTSGCETGAFTARQEVTILP